MFEFEKGGWIDTLITFVQSNETLAIWLVGWSVIAFIGTLLLIPYIVTRIPENYFSSDARRKTPWAEHHPVIRLTLIMIKNVLGYIFIIIGIVMLVLPGQGLLTILIGVMMIDFPGKYHWECWLVSRPAILRSINWLRRRADKAELRLK